MPFTVPDEELLPADPAPAGAPSGGFSVPAHELLNAQGQTPFDAAHAYLHRAGAGLPGDLDPKGDYETEFQKFNSQAKAFHDLEPLARLGSTLTDAAGHPLQSAQDLGAAVKTGVSTLAGKAWEGVKAAGSELAADAEEHPLRLPLDVLTATAAGAAKGLYGLGKLGVEAIGKGVFDPLVGLDPREGAASEARARRDFALRWYNTNREAPALKNVDANTNLRAVSAVAENAVPFFLPPVPALAGAGLASRGAEVVGSLVPRVAADVAADVGKGLQWVGSPKVAGAAGALSGIKLGAEFGGHGGAYVAGEVGRELGTALGGKLVQGGEAMENAARALAQSPGVAAGVERVVRPVLAAGETAGAGTAMGYAGAPSGSEEEGALRGLSLGLAAAPLAGIAAVRRPALGEAPAAVEARPAEVPAAAVVDPPVSVGASPATATAPALPAVVRDASPARQDAFTFLTLPKAKGGRGFNPADANARLDSAQAAGVAEDAAALIFHAQTGRTPREGGLPLAGLAATGEPLRSAPPPLAPPVPDAPVMGKALAGVPPVTPARAEAFGALTRGVDGLGPADANVRLNAAEAAGVRDTAGDLLLFARTGQKRASNALAEAR